jgi:hypothetical protein
MDQASPQCIDRESSLAAYRHDEPHDERVPRMVIHFPVMPGPTLTWRVEADCTLAVRDARVWLTRISSPYDHWLSPGDEFRLQRGERVWLSTDAERAAQVSLTTALPARRGMLAAWLARFASLGIGPLVPR